MSQENAPSVSRETPALAVTNLAAQLSGKPALHDISFDLPSGTLAALVGPNGSGKSTLLRCLTGVLRPTQGTIQIGGITVRPGNAHALSRLLSYVPQNNPMTFAFTVEELVALGAANTDAVEHALSAVELTALRARSVLSLSGGERQRAALGRALAQETPVLLLDEPITHLDPRHQVGILKATRAITRSGRTVLAVLHDLSFAATFADKILLLQDGHLIAQGTPLEALTPENLRRAYNIPFTFAVQPTGESPALSISVSLEDGNNSSLD